MNIFAYTRIRALHGSMAKSIGAELVGVAPTSRKLATLSMGHLHVSRIKIGHRNFINVQYKKLSSLKNVKYYG